MMWNKIKDLFKPQEYKCPECIKWEEIHKKNEIARNQMEMQHMLDLENAHKEIAFWKEKALNFQRSKYHS